LIVLNSVLTFMILIHEITLKQAIEIAKQYKEHLTRKIYSYMKVGRR
jgi:hypothetical protein